MTAFEAVSLLVGRFPALKSTVDEDDLWTSPHIAYSLLATEVLERRTTSTLAAVAEFIDELADSGDSLLEELLVIDVLEGIAQDPDVARLLRAKVSEKSAGFLDVVEREFFGRSR
ncbi:MAG: hypothetical protein LC114_14725 [Bryobacterales bacterium]|nr:hypothetical protein [Bryobacterales bacterium]